jgi:DNA-binding response OmpR family regulator
MARVLVVDAGQDIRERVARGFQRDEHEVVCAGSAEAALAVIARHGAPDAGVLDVVLPDLDGVALLTELRRRRPGLPAIFLTVLWSGHDIARMRAVGGLYVAKPFTATSLRVAMHRLLTPLPTRIADDPESGGRRLGDADRDALIRAARIRSVRSPRVAAPDDVLGPETSWTKIR